MKISALIKELQKSKKRFGDLPIFFSSPFGDVRISEAVVYDAAGNNPKGRADASEVYLHAGANKRPKDSADD